MQVARALVVGIGLVGALACSKTAPSGTSPTSSPVGIEWRLVSLGGNPVGPGANGQAATLTLGGESGRAGGYAGCNNFTGIYTLSGSSLTFGPLAMTRMACANGEQLERLYSMALEQTTEWTMSSKGLELRKGSTVLARFAR